MQLATGPVKSLSIDCYGPIDQSNTVTLSFIKGLLENVSEGRINFINANAEDSHTFLNTLTDACFLYLREQVKAGADVIQIFDSWANILDENRLNEFSMQYINKLTYALKNDKVTSETPIILFSRDPKCSNLTLVNDSGADCLSLYWNMKDFDLNLARNKVSLQGNLDPRILLEPKNEIKYLSTLTCFQQCDLFLLRAKKKKKRRRGR